MKISAVIPSRDESFGLWATAKYQNLSERRAAMDAHERQHNR